ncbi:MAG: polysaccharide biosynthesis protein [Saprospiraceae bacterium]|nr:MAG: polysaccharide biosynthesis protein [Saprospiraceae bacterium]
MKILQLCKKFPFPLKDGESIAVTSLSKALCDLGCEMTLLAMNTKKHYFDLNLLPDDFRHYDQIYTVEVDNRIKPLEALKNLFSPESYHISRFVSDQFSNKLIELLKREEFDVIQLETLYLAPYIPVIRKYSDAIIAMRAHNVEYEIWERITNNTRIWPKKWYLDHLTTKLKRFETQQLMQYDMMVAITDRDLKHFRSMGYRGPAVVTPIGLDMEIYKADFKSYNTTPSIAFIGSLDWMPNLEGLGWFLDNVWGKLTKKFPDLSLHVAGRNTPDWLKNAKRKNLVVHGEVPDALQFINQHSLMVVPLLSGSGMRAKILEGMALGKVVLTTSLGLEGIKAEDRSEVIVADTPEAFLEGIEYCLRQNGTLQKMGHQAQDFVMRHYESHHIASGLMNAYSSMMVEAL